MKNIKNDFRVLVEFRHVGDGVVCARLTPLVKFEPFDFKVFAEMVLSRLLPSAVSVHYLYDGTLILFSDDDDIVLDLDCCCERVTCSLPPFELNMELPDGTFRLVRFCLDQSDSLRRDYSFRDSRCLDLRGYFEIEMSDHETSED